MNTQQKWLKQLVLPITRTMKVFFTIPSTQSTTIPSTKHCILPGTPVAAFFATREKINKKITADTIREKSEST